MKTGNGVIVAVAVVVSQQQKKTGDMAAPTEFTLESVRDFILLNGGKVTNHELVKHFKIFLTDPSSKG